MAKKKKNKKHSFRNAVPRAPGAPKRSDETTAQRLLYTAGGMLGASVAGGFMKRENWIAPKTLAIALTAVGAGLAWKGDAPTIRSVGAGVMGASGGQLTMMMLDKETPGSTGEAKTTTASTTPSKLKNADQLPDAALLSALERARTRLALESREAA